VSAVDPTTVSRRRGAQGAVSADRYSEQQKAWVGLALAMAISAAVLLWEGRHATFQADELTYFQYFHDLDLRSLLTPHNAHLIFTTRLLYAGIFQTIGPVHAVFALVELFGVLLCALLFFLLAKRRVSPMVALALTLPLLFFGSSFDAVLLTVGIPAVYSIAAGLGMLLALERRDRRGEIAACVLLLVAVASFSFGLAFLVGAAVAVLVPPERRQQAWVFLLPLLAYLAWWLWARQFHQSSIEHPSNILLIPNYVADSLAAVTGSIAGVNYPIGTNPFAAPIDIGWGRVLAAVAVGAFWWRLRRRGMTFFLSLGVIVAVLLTLWSLLAIEASPTRTPEQTRYLFPGAVLLLLVVAEALRGARFSRVGLLVLFGAVALSLGANLKLLNDGSVAATDFAGKARAELGMVELSRGQVDPALVLSDASSDLQDSVEFPVSAGPYLAAVDDVGSFAFSPQEVLQQDESVREGADSMLAHALGLQLEPAKPPASLQGCQKESQRSGPAVIFSLPPGGALLGLAGAAPTQMQLRRFATLYAPTLDVPPGEKWLALKIPTDSAPQPWWGAISSAGPVTVCPLGS
jgi:hypothetical protein